MMGRVFPSVSILGVEVDVVDLEELENYVIATVEAGRKASITYVNVHAVNLAHRDELFRAFINDSDVALCDGFGVKWAVQWLAGVSLQRLSPPDWFRELAVECARRGHSVYLLGARPAIIKKAGAVLTQQVPGLKIAGVHHGYFDKQNSGTENREVVARINSLKPDVLMVGFGMPFQEKWIAENWDNLNVHVVFTVGAFFDYVSGALPRLPRWMTDRGLEWLGRLVIEPRRLWKRYLLGNPVFFWRVLMQGLHTLRLDPPP